MTKHVGFEQRLTLRATRTEWERLNERAQAAGLSVSRYLVETGLTSSNPPTPETRAERERLLYELRKIGVNLNQLARRGNSGLPVSADQLARTLTAASALLARLQGSVS